MKTKLMLKLFSEDTTPEFKEKVSDKIDEALENGKAELKTKEEDLKFAAVDDEVIIEDANNNEVTKVTNPKDENVNLESVDINKGEDDDKVVEDTKSESVSEPDVKTEVVEGKDGDHLTNTVPEVTIDIMEGIGDAKKAGVKGKNFSITLKNATMDQIKAAYKAFADVEVDEVDVEEPVNEVEDKDETKMESDAESEKKADEIIEKATELKEAAKDMVTEPTKDKAEKVKDECEKVKQLCDENDDVIDSTEVKSYCKIFSEQADAILAKADIDANKEDKKPEEGKVEEAEEGPKETTKVESEGTEDVKDEKEVVDETKDEDKVLEDTKKTFSATESLLDSVAAPCPAFLHENKGDKLFSKNENRKSSNKFLYTSFE